nr:acyltransferase [Novosphingobium piscinae]
MTGLRGLAAWYVVFYHLRLSLTGLLPAPAIAALAKGYLAVDLFFMLSGFVLWLSYAPALAAPTTDSVVRFWWRRMARIWPLHAVVLAGFVGLAAVLALTGRDTAGYPPAELPLHLLLVQNWGFTPDLAWNHPAWSISAEMAAYLLFPLLAWCGRGAWPVGRVLLLAALLLGGLHALFAAHGADRLGAAIPTLGLPRCLLEFTLGTLLARLWLGWHDHPCAARRAGQLAAGAGLTGLAGWALALPETAWVPLAFAQALLALALDRGRLARGLAHGPLHWLGEVSYSTYLCHFGLFIGFKLLWVDATLQLDAVRLAGFVGLLLGVSALGHRLVELPAQRALTRLAPARRLRPGAA